MSIVQKATEEFKIPEILERRTLPEELRGSRFLDDEEVVISSLIDQNGHISRIFDFMLILTRIEKFDHRLLCLQLLKNYLSKEQSLQFVENGGFRILRRWMKVAEDADNVDELRFILSVCEKLPLVESAVRQSEIGKSIKRLTKHVSPAGRNVNELYSAANRVMELWKEQLRVAQASSTVDSSTEKSKPTPSNSSNEVKSKSSPNAPETNVVSAEAKVDSEVSSSKAKPSTSIPATTTTAAMNSTESTGKTIPPAKSTRLIDLIRRSEPIAANSTSFSSTFPTTSTSSTSTPLLSVVGSSNNKLSGEKRERRSLDMEASAKRLLESKQQRQSSTAGNDSSAMDEDDTTNANGGISATAPISELKPVGKGGLRSKTSAPKKKLNITWADETGGLLREVRYIEVEKIKSSVANYKSHKDMVKREKQMEKETHFTGKFDDEMITKTSEWRVPKRLLLPIDITDNMGVPTDSKEKDVQQQRQSLALGVIYLDDSLIPDDPEEDANITNNGDTAASSFMDVDETSNPVSATVPSSSSKKVHEISWYMEDETPVVEYVAPTTTSMPAMMFNANDNGFMFNQPHQQQLQQQYFDQNGMNNNINNNNSMMMNMNMNNMFQNNNNNMMNNNGNNVMNNLFLAANIGDLQSFFSCLPAVLQPLLDPHTVRILMQDPSLVSTLLLSGDIMNSGAVNTYNVHVLQSSTSSTDYRMKINLPPLVQQQFGNNMMGGNNNNNMNNMNNNMNNNSRWGSNTNSTGGMHMPVANMMQNQSQPQQQQHHTTKKSQVPCRYFNTARGCMNGDKCPFGHFGQGHVSSAAGHMNRGGGSGGNATGDSSSVAHAAVAAAAAAATALMSNGGYVGTGGAGNNNSMMNNGGGPGMMQSQRSNMPMMGTNVNAGGRMNRRRR